MLLTLNSGTVTDLWKEEFRDAIPRAVSFVDKGNSVVVYGLMQTALVYVWTPRLR